MTTGQPQNAIRHGKAVLILERLEPRTLLSVFPWSSPDQIGNSFAMAHLLELDAEGDAVFESLIDNPRDRDMFIFTVSGDGIVQIDMITPDSGLDAYLYVYNDRHRLIARDNDGGDETDARVSFDVQAGEVYTIRADAYLRSTGSYTLILDGPAEGDLYIDDFGDTFDQATPLILDENGAAELTGEIGWMQDQDMFVFTTVIGGTMQIDMITPDSTLDSYLYIYDENMNLIVSDDDSGVGIDAQVMFEVEAGSQYYLQADAWRYSIGTYLLELSVPLPAEIPSDGDDPSDENLLPKEGDGPIKGWALLIGAWDYQGEEDDLEECASDVAMMENVLINTYGFTPEAIHTISGGADEVNRAVIDSEFDWLQENADAEDFVFFYYTGHGDYGNRYYRNDNEALVLPTEEYYTEANLEAQLEQIDSGATKIVVLDTCYSGGFTGLSRTVANTCVIASSAYNQVSWGYVEQFLPEEATGSVFTSWLLRAMQDDGALNVDTNLNGQISMTEAFAYADRNIRSITQRRFYQDPVMSPTTEEFEINLTTTLLNLSSEESYLT